MGRIIEETESDRSGLVPALREVDRTQPALLSQAALTVGDGLDAKAVVAFTLSGNTVRRLARLHPSEHLIAVTPDRAVRDQLALSWGTTPVLVPDAESAEDMVRVVDETLLALDGFTRGDIVVVIAGAPPHTIGVTDLLRVHRLGDVGQMPLASTASAVRGPRDAAGARRTTQRSRAVATNTPPTVM